MVDSGLRTADEQIIPKILTQALCKRALYDAKFVEIAE